MLLAQQQTQRRLERVQEAREIQQGMSLLEPDLPAQECTPVFSTECGEGDTRADKQGHPQNHQNVDRPELHVSYRLPKDLTVEDQALLERSSRTSGRYMWLHTWLFPTREPVEHQGQQYSILVDSGNPMELLISIQQLPPDCPLLEASAHKFDVLHVTICGSKLISRYRAILSVQVGEEYIPLVATVYNGDDLKGGKLPPILGFSFLKDNGIGFTPAPTIRSRVRSNNKSAIRLNRENEHLLLSAKVPCGHLLRMKDGNPTQVAELYSTQKPKTFRQFALLASQEAEPEVTSFVASSSEDTHQVSTSRDELLQPLELQAIKVDATAFAGLKRNDLLVIEESEDPKIRDLRVLVLSGVTEILRPGLTATIIVLSLHRSPLRLPAGTPIAAASRFDKSREIRDSAGRPIRFAFVDGKLAWTGEDYVQKKVLLAQAHNGLYHHGNFNPHSKEGQVGVEKLLQHQCILMAESGVDLEDEQAVEAFVTTRTKQKRQQLLSRESGTARFLGVDSQGRVTVQSRPSRGEQAVVSDSQTTEASVNVHLTDREELESPGSGEHPTGAQITPEPVDEDDELDSDPMTRKLRRCPPAFEAELRRISDPRLRDKVTRAVTHHRNMSARLDSTDATVLNADAEEFQPTNPGEESTTTTTQEAQTDQSTGNKRQVVEDALRVTDDTQKTPITKEDVHRPEVRAKLEELLVGSKVIPEDLSNPRKKAVKDLIHEYGDLFTKEITHAGPTDESFEINLEVMEPKGAYRSHNVPRSLKSEAIIRQVLEQYLIQGIIEPTSEQQWTSPVFTLRKANKDPSLLSSYRVLSDLRFVNAHIKNNIHSTTVPMIKKLFSRFEGASWAALFDLTSGYTQLKLNKESRRYTAFSAPPPLPPRMAFVRCPQGLAFLPSQFMAIMHRVVGDLCNTSVLVYLDDMVVVASTFEELLQEVRKLFDRLREHNMVLSLPKSVIGTRQFDFLGHRFDLSQTESRGVTVQHKKVEAILQAKMPRDVSELRAQLGSFQYYKDFIPGYANIAAPLHELTGSSPSKVVVAGPPKRINNDGTAAHAEEVKMTAAQEKQWRQSQKKKKGKKRKAKSAGAFVWDDAVHGAAIRTLKRCLTEDVVLKIHSCHPDALLRIRTDASDRAVGSVLEQLVIHGPHAGKYRPIGYASSKLKDVQRRWSATERECWGVIAGLEYWHQFICGRQVSVYCDHKALQYVFSPEYQCNGSTRGRLFRWRARAAMYGNVELYYVRGSLMESSGPDYLSRMERDESITAKPVPLVDVLGELDPPEDEVVFCAHSERTRDDQDPHDSSINIPTIANRDIMVALAQSHEECQALRCQVQATADSVEHIVGLLTDPVSLDEVRDTDETSSNTSHEQPSATNTVYTEVTVGVGDTTTSAPRQGAGDGSSVTTSQRDAPVSTRLRSRRRRLEVASGEGEDSRKISKSHDPHDNNNAATTAATSPQQQDTEVPSQATKATVRRCLDGSTRDDLLWKLMGTRDYWSVLDSGLQSSTSPKDEPLRDAIQWLRHKKWPTAISDKTIARVKKHYPTRALKLKSRQKRADKLSKHLRINDRDVLVYEARTGAMCLVIPVVIQREMIQYFHDAAPSGGCHRSVENTYKAIAQCCYWPSLWDDVMTYVRKCDHCQRFKHSTHSTKNTMVTGFPMYNMEKVAVDHIVALPETKNGNKNILVIVDLASRWAVAVPLKTVSIQETADAFVNEFVCSYGVPRTMISDNGVAFEAELARRIYRRLGVHQNFSSALYPQSNGAVERLNGTLKTLLRMMANENADNWDEVLPLALMAYRNAVHRSTQVSPYELLFGRPMRVPITAEIKGLVDPQQPLNSSQQEYLRQLEERITTQLRSAGNRVIAGQMKRLEQGDDIKEYPVGSRVFAKIGARAGVARKLAALYRPGTVVRNFHNGGHIVELDGDEQFKTINVRRNSDKLKPCWFEKDEVLGVPSVEGDRLYEVDAIEDVRRVENVRGQADWQVRVSWSAYSGPERLSNWMPISDINPAGLDELLQEYHERHPDVSIPLKQSRGSRRKAPKGGRKARG